MRVRADRSLGRPSYIIGLAQKSGGKKLARGEGDCVHLVAERETFTCPLGKLGAGAGLCRKF